MQNIYSVESHQISCQLFVVSCPALPRRIRIASPYSADHRSPITLCASVVNLDS